MTAGTLEVVEDVTVHVVCSKGDGSESPGPVGHRLKCIMVVVTACSNMNVNEVLGRDHTMERL